MVTPRWPGRFARSNERDDAVRRARDDAVAAFLDMDKRQSIASTGVDAVESLTPQRSLHSQWTPVEKSCFDAGAAYLSANERFADESSQEAFDAFAAAVDLLGNASRGVDKFYDAHRAQLESATEAMAAVPRIGNEARTAAETVLRTLDPSNQLHQYLSVTDAESQLRAELQVLAGSNDATSTKESAARVRTKTAALSDALAQAPAAAEAAAHALASVRTRLEAVGTKADGIGPAFSALLREFVAASSNDLAHAREFVDDHMSAARTDIDAAAEKNRHGDPERALESITHARAHLADAEAQISVVVGRLARLREAQRDHAAAESAVRFHLRDAQLLAVDRGLVAEWGSVLDAQRARLERAHSTLDTRRPDYWSYLQEIDSISEFIASTVDRMRGRA